MYVHGRCVHTSTEYIIFMYMYTWHFSPISNSNLIHFQVQPRDTARGYVIMAGKSLCTIYFNGHQSACYINLGKMLMHHNQTVIW